ncbi:hypothetical protein BDW42DRAFT_181976 [Aspergillus taichungensis]|uniref:Uncharacterized protein n=1 Tax=Aspergillus taichungensis TaxID=482145 RepID=A0A2J5HCW0_9EURO|nr:hypothetical protein BDW42DRAFT_181976 [Aspergillus taichungensis]
MAQANLIVQLPEMINYAHAMSRNGMAGLGRFEVPWVQQREVLQGRDKLQVLTRTDEASVNSSIISFLQAITSFVPWCNREWRTSRVSLHADFGTVNGRPRRRHYAAITDGELQDKTTHKLLCLVECKRSQRESHSPQVDMQEVAEIVAWIKQYPDTAPAGLNSQYV